MNKWRTLAGGGTYATYTAGLKGVSRGELKTGQKAYIEISDYRWLIKSLGQINDEAQKEFKKQIRKAASPVQDEIKKSIRANRLGRKGMMRGFAPKAIPGRLTWGTGKPAASAIISTPRVNAKRNALSVARVRVSSPATVVADMAGKSNKATNRKAYTDPYEYSLTPKGSKLHNTQPGYRIHKITITGSRKFIQNLNSRLGNTASRMVYPGAEKAMPETIRAYGEIIGDALATIQRKVNEVK